MKKIEKLVIKGEEHTFTNKKYYLAKDGSLYIKMADNEKGGGYINDRLTSDLGENINITRHQLVGQTYLKKSHKDGYIINHKNENKTDNRTENLEWVSPAYNVIYSRRGLYSQQLLFDVTQKVVEDEKAEAIKKVLHDLQEKGYIPPLLEKMLIHEYTNKPLN